MEQITGARRKASFQSPRTQHPRSWTRRWNKARSQYQTQPNQTQPNPKSGRRFERKHGMAADRERDGGMVDFDRNRRSASGVRFALECPGRSQRIGALEHRGAAYPAHPAPGSTGGADSLRPPAGGVSFSAPGPGHADRAQQSDPDWPVAGADLFPDAARGHGDLSDRSRALREGAGGRTRRPGPRHASAAPLHAEVCPGKRSGAVSRTGADAAPGPGRRLTHAGGGSGLHRFRAEDRIPDWRGAVLAFSGDRSGGGGGDHFDRHAAAAAGGDFDAAENFAVCHGRRLEPADRVADEEFCLTADEKEAQEKTWVRDKSSKSCGTPSKLPSGWARPC